MYALHSSDVIAHKRGSGTTLIVDIKGSCRTSSTISRVRL